MKQPPQADEHYVAPSRRAMNRGNRNSKRSRRRRAIGKRGSSLFVLEREESPHGVTWRIDRFTEDGVLRAEAEVLVGATCAA